MKTVKAFALLFLFISVRLSASGYYDAYQGNSIYGGGQYAQPQMAQPVDYYGAGYGNVGYGAPISSDMMNSYYQNGYYGGGMTGTMLDYFMPNRLVLEPFVYAHYNLSIANYAGGEVPYSTIFNKTLPAGFGVAVGVRVNRIFLAEFDITGASDRKVSTIQGVDYLQKTDFVFLRFNLGLSIPISGTNRPYGRSFMEEILMSKHDKKVNILILGGFITAFRNVSFGDGKIPPNAIGTTMGVLPEVGGGLEFWINHRFSLRTSFRYAFKGTDPVLTGLFTWDIGAQIKL
jgi:hypothetical protein